MRSSCSSKYYFRISSKLSIPDGNFLFSIPHRLSSGLLFRNLVPNFLTLFYLRRKQLARDVLRVSEIKLKRRLLFASFNAADYILRGKYFFAQLVLRHVQRLSPAAYLICGKFDVDFILHGGVSSPPCFVIPFGLIVNVFISIKAFSIVSNMLQ